MGRSTKSISITVSIGRAAFTRSRSADPPPSDQDPQSAYPPPLLLTSYKGRKPSPSSIQQSNPITFLPPLLIETLFVMVGIPLFARFHVFWHWSFTGRYCRDYFPRWRKDIPKKRRYVVCTPDKGRAFTSYLQILLPSITMVLCLMARRSTQAGIGMLDSFDCVPRTNVVSTVVYHSRLKLA